jgi:hypothetical protein|tara:strand:+ start:8823 stop:8942 length:120 start_codon:yes stop_codon:yes gene_type:complete
MPGEILNILKSSGSNLSDKEKRKAALETAQDYKNKKKDN